MIIVIVASNFPANEKMTMGKPCQLVFQYRLVDEQGSRTDKHHTCAGQTSITHVQDLHDDACNQVIPACVVKGTLGSLV